MPRPTSYAVFCLKKKRQRRLPRALHRVGGGVALADSGVVVGSDHDVWDPPSRAVTMQSPEPTTTSESQSACTTAPPLTSREIGRQTMNAIAATMIFFKDTAATDIYTLSLHDALPICW